MTEWETLKRGINENNFQQVSGVMQQLRPSQIDREQLIREVEINRYQCEASRTQWQTNGKEINEWVGVQGWRAGKMNSGNNEQPRLW